MNQIAPTTSWEIELSRLISLDGLISLEQHFGGSFIYIHASEPSEALINAVGEERAKVLCGWFGGSDIYVPKVALKQLRNKQIETAALDSLRTGNSTGKTVKELAAKFRLTTRRIATILKERGIYGSTGETTQ
ncbi:hypothetical protein JYB87_11970 [Shewanella avicenniae]|uniref:Mor transcription activator domain-containing protein n=1 Tax=Shewanella avicenniae TaxID=2814294 RepID=A0ABX7QN83_9GAMM|nr:Mor transcription activator family protein [Shewanella avicenniae]QSX32482.1 hypothetical protein JYB87_11970 [Shewanella avicenniae]